MLSVYSLLTAADCHCLLLTLAATQVDCLFCWLVIRCCIVLKVATGRYSNMLIANGFESLRLLLYADRNDLKQCGVKIGHAAGIMNQIQAAAEADKQRDSPGTDSQGLQVTVLSVY